jgi:hypothetical protein
MVKPFGPTILETDLPAEILTSFLALTDKLMRNPNRESYGPYLVGQIKEEPLITIDLLKEVDVLDYLESMFAEYVLASASVNADQAYQSEVRSFQSSNHYRNPVEITIEAAWLVSQRKGEYNPIHNHSNAALSSVLYLKVPNFSSSVVPGKTPTDGQIEFVDGSTQPLQNATARVTPCVGKFFIFPSYLLHLVYPFHSDSDSERRSVSINASYKT